LKVYAPEIFGDLLNDDQDFLNLDESLEFRSNAEEIKNSSGADGGKSGEFFFFSKDKKIIIKTIPDTEKNMMVNILERYIQHLKEYPNTLIAKTYGIYTYANADLGLKFNIIILKNINGFSSKYVERVYDMKGSTYDRQVVRTSISSKADLTGQVLKDTDFEKYEKKLYIKEDLRKQICDQAEADALFFRRVRLIDYSLMVFCVNKKKYWEDNGRNAPDHTAKNPLASAENELEPGYYYNIGIVDYLQPYNCNKMTERMFKRLRRLDPNLDTSTQPPQIYSDRFVSWVYKIAS